MNRPMPQVREFMTLAPITVDASLGLKLVREKMKASDIRHLPVKQAGKIAGIISDRNVKSALGFPHSDSFTASDVMMREPYTVLPETPLDEVAAAMAEEKYGCVLVESLEGELLGIFTAVDACRALRQVLETFYPT